MTIPHVVLWTVATYAAAGAMFAAWFVTAGVARVDAAARGAPIGLRVLIIPGSVALWPLLLIKMFSSGGDHR